MVVSLWGHRKQEGTGGQARGHTQWDSWGHRGCTMQGQGGGARARPSVSTEVDDLRKVLRWGLLLPWSGPFHTTLPCPAHSLAGTVAGQGWGGAGVGGVCNTSWGHGGLLEPG